MADGAGDLFTTNDLALAPTGTGADLVPSVEAIDAELAQLAADAATVTDLAVAASIEQRRLALQAPRRVALALVAVRKRREAAEQARQAHAGFSQLEAELPAALRARAVALDEWVASGAELVDAYRTTLARCVALHDLALVPTLPGREFDLLSKRQRLDVQAPLAESLARQGVIALDLSRAQRNPERTVEAHVVALVAQLFAAVRQRLPAADEEHVHG